jgi:release factor glutamine methyltransferase
MGCERIHLYARFEETVPPEKLAAFRGVVKRRGAREPAQYIIGETEFCGRTFKTDRRALIPRPETEIVAETTLRLVEKVATPCLVDVGTGSGILAITAALAKPDAKVVACDISGDALALARENADRHKILERIDFRQGDFAETLVDLAGKANVVMANPPYVAESELQALEHEVRDHEPRVALVAGPEGTEIVRRLLDLAPTLLAPGGHLVMEIGLGQAATIRKLIDASPGLTLVGFETDFNRIERVVVVRRNDQ